MPTHIAIGYEYEDSSTNATVDDDDRVKAGGKMAWGVKGFANCGLQGSYSARLRWLCNVNLSTVEDASAAREVEFYTHDIENDRRINVTIQSSGKLLKYISSIAMAIRDRLVFANENGFSSTILCRVVQSLIFTCA
ncbi:hypothetical protein Fot_05014 [Forsythia ovata]|uniref:Uncharacterized protein n=1 Tax=Forsythia ovata TaxID=205694 RepID=A0ABD1WPJ9_9LAMI